MHLTMNSKLVTAAAAAAMLASCGGGATPFAGGAPASGTPAQLRAQRLDLPASRVSASIVDHRASWMSPEAKKKSSLLYVADEATDDVYVYSYPAGTLEGTLTGFATPSGICTNKRGDVFVLNGNGTTISVYAHGGSSLLRSLDLPGYPEFNCSVDPKTGNLAVGALAGSCGDCIAVFADAQGEARTYDPSGQNGLPGCGYDNKGNLFCDAYGSDGAFALYELPAKSSTVSQISVSGMSGVTGGWVQWDGKDLAVGTDSSGTIDRLALSGSSAKVQGTMTLTGAGDVWQAWLVGSKKRANRIVAPTYGGSLGAIAGYWKYPAGGNPTQTIGGFSQPDGAAVSTVH